MMIFIGSQTTLFLGRVDLRVMPDDLLIFVFDTNIFIRLALGRSLYAQHIRQLWMTGHFVVASAESILGEVERALHYPAIQRDYSLSDADIENFMQLIRSVVILTDELYEVDTIKADASDNIFLACALESAADYLISEDGHIREIKYYRGTQIIGFDQLEALLSA